VWTNTKKNWAPGDAIVRLNRTIMVLIVVPQNSGDWVCVLQGGALQKFCTLNSLNMISYHDAWAAPE